MILVKSIVVSRCGFDLHVSISSSMNLFFTVLLAIYIFYKVTA